MNLDGMMANPQSQSLWFQMPEGKKFLAWAELERASALKALKVATDPVEIYRAQGKIEELDKILNLPEVIAEHQRQVKSGKRQPVSER